MQNLLKEEKKFIRKRIEKNKRLYSTKDFNCIRKMLSTNEILYTTYIVGCVDTIQKFILLY